MPDPIDPMLNASLANLPAVDGGPEGWSAVQRKLQRRDLHAARLRQGLSWSMAASVVVLASVVALNVTQRRAAVPVQSIAAVASPRPVEDVDQLRAQSVALEQLLA